MTDGIFVGLFLLVMVTSIFVCPFARAQRDNNITVALIADKASGLHKSPLVSLLEVKLSQKEGIELLERAEIDKLLQEQQLSVAGLLQRHSLIRAGQLLRADAFLLLAEEHSKGEGTVGLIETEENHYVSSEDLVSESM